MLSTSTQNSLACFIYIYLFKEEEEKKSTWENKRKAEGHVFSI
jgi:hypothetical protein